MFQIGGVLHDYYNWYEEFKKGRGLEQPWFRVQVHATKAYVSRSGIAGAVRLPANWELMP